MGQLAPVLIKALQVMGTAAGAAAIQNLLDRYEKTFESDDAQAVVVDAQLVAKAYILSRLLGKLGLSGVATFYDAGYLSAGEFFFCCILTWSGSELPVSNSTAADLEGYALAFTPTSGKITEFSTVTAVAPAEISNDTEALRRAFAYLVNFVRANQVMGVIPVFN